MNKLANKFHEQNECHIIDVSFFCKKRCLSIVKSEAGASPNHNLIVTNIIRVISDFYFRECCFNKTNQEEIIDPQETACARCVNVFPSDVYIENLYSGVNKKHFFADVVIVQGPIQTRKQFITNPKIAIEVFSPGNKHVEMIDKIKSFKMYPSFEEFIIVQSETKNVSVYKRSNQWMCENHTDDFNIESLGNFKMKFNDIYFKWNKLEAQEVPKQRFITLPKSFYKK